MAMIDWDSDTWGDGVTYAANGSWVRDKHGDDTEVDRDEADPGEADPGEVHPIAVEPAELD